MNDWNDRIVDAALHELHGSKPPDLSARVLAALQEAPRGPLPQLLPRPRRVWPRLVAAAVVSMLGGVGSAYVVARSWSANQAAREDGLAIELAVLHGDLECVEDGVRRAVAAGQAAPAFLARTGNRLRAEAPASFRFDAFGRFEMQAHTELEVSGMDFTKKNGVVVASSLTLAVLSGGAGWYAGSHVEMARAGEVLHVQSPASDAPALAAENAQLKQRLAELEGRNQELLAQTLRRESAPPVAPPPAAEAAAATPAPVAPAAVPLAFSDARFAEALAKIDWQNVGAVTNEMAPLLTKLAEALAKEGGEVPVDVAVAIQKLNQKLIDPVVALMKAGVPGTGPNGSYTNPVVVANQLASTLASAGKSLSEAQQQQIAGLVRSFGAEAQAVADAQHEFALDKLLAETEVKERFYKETGGLLTPDQYGALYPEGASKYEGTSLFSTGVLLRQFGEPVRATDAADYARVVATRMQEQLGLDDAAMAQVRTIVASSAGSAGMWNEPAAPIETSAQAHFLRAGRTQGALRAQVGWMRAIQQQLPLSEEQRRKLGKMQRVFVPLPR